MKYLLQIFDSCVKSNQNNHLIFLSYAHHNINIVGGISTNYSFPYTLYSQILIMLNIIKSQILIVQYRIVK